MEYGTRRTQIVMDYDDFLRVMEEFADKVVNEVLELIKAEHPKEQDDLLTIEQVSEYLGVTKPTLHRWNKLGYLTRFHVGRKVRYRRADVERAVQIKGVH